ncbi:alpha/beta fold hydrolase [Nonomuraea monospora]|uniref:Alpha/beta fold hydrolase n=1 Tax=Nonomuraea monospora TaxID=568818 RepID=A0ABN3D397_9ACTN
MKRNVVFIHGLWIHSTSWQPWQEHFERERYDTYAPGWPGDAATVAATRADPTGMAGVGVDEITYAYTEFFAGLSAPPIVIGHSFGGLIGPEAPGPRPGCGGCGHLTHADQGNPRPAAEPTALQPPRAGESAEPEQDRRADRQAVRLLLRQCLPAAESAQLHQRFVIPGPGRPLFQASSAGFTPNAPTAVDTRRVDREPLLLVAAGKDRTVPAAVVQAAHKLYAASSADTELAQYPERGHSTPFDRGWRGLSEATLDWLARRGL